MHAPFRRLLATSLFALGLTGVSSGAGLAQSYPAQPIRILVGYTPGGGVDITSRLIAQSLQEQFKQTVIVENRPGAQSDIASEAVAKSAPDGYTLLMITTSYAINAATVQGQKFDPIKDFTTITLVAENPNLVLLQPSVPAKTIQELIAYGKANPGKLNVGYTGSVQEAIGKDFAKNAGIEITQIPYKGASDMTRALLSNEIHMYFGSTSSSGQFVRDGSMRALAIAAAARSETLPDVPTAAEAGLPNFKASTWYGLMGPANLPKPIVDKLNAAVKMAQESPKVKEVMTSNGQQAMHTTPEGFLTILKDEIARAKAGT